MELLSLPVIVILLASVWLVASDLAVTYIRKRIRRIGVPSLPEDEGDWEGEP